MRRFAYVSLILWAAGCGEPKNVLVLDFEEQEVKSVIFSTQVIPANLDGETTPEGQDILDDAIVELTLMVSDRRRLCDLVTQAVEEGALPDEFDGQHAGLLRVQKFELESTGTPFDNGDLIVNDQTGSILAAFINGGRAFGQIDTVERGSFKFTDIDEGEDPFLEANGGAQGTRNLEGGQSTNFAINMSVETKDFCPALSLLPFVPGTGL